MLATSEQMRQNKNHREYLIRDENVDTPRNKVSGPVDCHSLFEPIREVDNKEKKVPFALGNV